MCPSFKTLLQDMKKSFLDPQFEIADMPVFDEVFF